MYIFLVVDAWDLAYDYEVVTISVSNADADGDGVADPADNCLQVPNGPGEVVASINAGQFDAGDADFDNDGLVEIADCPNADFDGDGYVIISEATTCASMQGTEYFGNPGISGRDCAWTAFDGLEPPCP